MTEISVTSSGNFRLAAESPLADNSDTMPEKKDNLDAARRRLLALVDKTEGANLSSLSMQIGKNRSYLENYVRKGSPQQLAHEDRVDLARILNVHPDELAVASPKRLHTKGMVATTTQAGLASSSRGQRTDGLYEPLAEPVNLIGEVQAGAWVESYQLPKEQWIPMDLPTDPQYPGVPRYALRNVGESMNRECSNGGMWIFVELGDLVGVGPQPGDYVIVERIRRDGPIEATCKRFEIRGGKVWLCPDSYDPTFEPLPISGDPEIEEVVVRGLVVQVVDRPGRKR